MAAGASEMLPAPPRAPPPHGGGATDAIQASMLCHSVDQLLVHVCELVLNDLTMSYFPWLHQFLTWRVDDFGSIAPEIDASCCVRVPIHSKCVSSPKAVAVAVTVAAAPPHPPPAWPHAPAPSTDMRATKFWARAERWLEDTTTRHHTQLRLVRRRNSIATTPPLPPPPSPSLSLRRRSSFTQRTRAHRTRVEKMASACSLLLLLKHFEFFGSQDVLRSWLQLAQLVVRHTHSAVLPVRPPLLPRSPQARLPRSISASTIGRLKLSRSVTE